MNYSLGNMLSRGGALNPDGLALDLQFAADKTLTARKGPTPTFTRASTATFVGSNGLIQTAAINAPRFDHDPVTLASRGLLIEESRTNVALYSEALVLNTGWTGFITSTVSGTGPNGSAAYELAESTSNTAQTFINTGGTGGAGATSITSGTTYTGSIFLKKISGSIDWVQITLSAVGFGPSQYANINLSNGSIGNSIGGTARVEAHANGWYRVSWTVAANATTTSSPNVAIAGIQNTNGTTRAPQYTGSASNRFLAAMCQFELGSFPTSYIPTTTTALTRSADVCSITGSDFSKMWNLSEGTMLSRAQLPTAAAAASPFILDFYNAAFNEWGLRLFANAFQVVQRDGTLKDFIVANLSSQPFTFAAAYNSLSSSGSVYGLVVSGVGLSLNNFANLEIGRRSNGLSSLNGHISSVRYYRKRLSDAKLQSLTS